ncbi:hypothetical protein GXN76_13175 [Kroppenstedtia pulmonis]|uniref:Uncharacterized protein n=1 Tax=Kroppenstedtia pulmonis TaxID=1380685 RepID=A0A7D4BR77_9BACL|nr:hypothetical protein [Kroppenstedtia pulmonis]QKG85331.1 hypothetical protein GXN76_13175 [Kroppenstedtia pulmonis]
MKKPVAVIVISMLLLCGAYFIYENVSEEDEQVVLIQNSTRMECLQKHEIQYSVSNENGKPIIRLKKADLDKLSNECK